MTSEFSLRRRGDQARGVSDSSTGSDAAVNRRLLELRRNRVDAGQAMSLRQQEQAHRMTQDVSRNDDEDARHTGLTEEEQDSEPETRLHTQARLKMADSLARESMQSRDVEAAIVRRRMMRRMQQQEGVADQREGGQNTPQELSGSIVSVQMESSARRPGTALAMPARTDTRIRGNRSTALAMPRSLAQRASRVGPEDPQSLLDRQKREAAIEARERELRQDFVSTRQAADELRRISTYSPDYTLEQAREERPYTHYSRAGNIFQILRFGLQGGNFKNRFDQLRDESAVNERLAKQMNGLRAGQGGSYQNQDSICMSQYADSLFMHPSQVLFLVNPDVSVIGESKRDETTGYGTGIPTREIGQERFSVGNPTAYNREVLGVNIVLPKDIRAVVMSRGEMPMNVDLQKVVKENVVRANLSRARDREDIVANTRLIAELAQNRDIYLQVLQLEIDLEHMDKASAIEAVQVLQKRALQAFTGDERVSDESLIQAIEKKFKIRILKK